MIEIKVETNGYEISTDLQNMISEFNFRVKCLFKDCKIEHFYYGSKLVMTSITFGGCNTADFNISANRVAMVGYATQKTYLDKCKSLTFNDECYKSE